MNRCKDCIRYDTSSARYVKPPPLTEEEPTPRHRPVMCPPEEATIVCRTTPPPRIVPPEEPPHHVCHARPPQAQSGYRCLCTVPKEVMEDPSRWCRCCQKETNVEEPGGEEVTHSVKLVYELPTPKFDDLSITQKDFHTHPMQKREIPSWHPCKTEYWSRPDVPSASETTYQHDYLPPPSHREDKKSVLLMPRGEERPPPCRAVPCYRNICEDEPAVWNVYRRTETKEEAPNGEESEEYPVQHPPGRLVLPPHCPRHGLSMCEAANESKPADWWKISSGEDKEPEVDLKAKYHGPKTLFRDESTYAHDYSEPPPIPRNPKDSLKNSIDTNGYTTTHKADYTPPRIITPNTEQTNNDFNQNHRNEDDPCYWAKLNPAEPNCWTRRGCQKMSDVVHHPVRDDLSARNYKSSLIDVKTEGKDGQFDTSCQLSRTGEVHRPWKSRSVYA